VSRSAGSDFERGRRSSFSRGVRSALVRGYLIATTVLFFGAGVFAFIVTLGSDDSIAGRITSGAVTSASSTSGFGDSAIYGSTDPLD
jgi:hypothetical protein